ncbi:hypothetical protein F10086_63 [Staphylococcus phage vB_SauM_JDF86]|nr:hypothetical protein F10086_63 [Staphylococcus phage vB_SauM_JDF86]
MATEQEPRVFSKLSKKARVDYIEKHNIDMYKFLELESNGKIGYELVIEHTNKLDNSTNELTITGEHVSLIISSEKFFNGRLEDTIDTKYHNLKIKEVRIKEQ